MVKTYDSYPRRWAYISIFSFILIVVLAILAGVFKSYADWNSKGSANPNPDFHTGTLYYYGLIITGLLCGMTILFYLFSIAVIAVHANLLKDKTTYWLAIIGILFVSFTMIVAACRVLTLEEKQETPYNKMNINE
ncbi:hypothetical protein H9M94_00810 [Mycoplasma sp. Pen4]|uniref:hypothetical protein n=1 Tax=Mycoplasma sp. Pen4 TaxID=640330 RepID=UPI0016544469|nr:hypothetical protein [Mycoplasma sp. Pen4]QNM93802.1 hypothetical protein H9M94_00810 [Mycoplasma sp. Pen4]